VKLQQSIIIDRPIAEVFAYRSALHQTAEWQRNVIATDLLEVGPIALGSRGTEQRLGQREEVLEWQLEVTEFEPNSVLEIMSRCGDVRVQERVMLAPDEANTRYTVCLEMTGSRLPTAAFHRQTIEALMTFKWRLEGRTEP
jgi:uncharacterized membrane protein